MLFDPTKIFCFFYIYFIAKVLCCFSIRNEEIQLTALKNFQVSKALYFLGHFFKGGFFHLKLSLLVFVFLGKKDLRLIAFVVDLAGQSFSQFRADSHARRLLFPSFLLALIMHSCIEIQYGGQQIILFVLSRHRSKVCSKRQSQA